MKKKFLKVDAFLTKRCAKIEYFDECRADSWNSGVFQGVGGVGVGALVRVNYVCYIKDSTK